MAAHGARAAAGDAAAVQEYGRFLRHTGRPQEDNCAEENRMIAIGGRMYLEDSEGYLMPLQKDEPPPDPKLFQKYFGPKK